MSDGPARGRENSDLWTIALVALAARALVLIVAWNRFPPTDDGVYYDTLARRLAEGLGYTWAWPDGVVTSVAHYPVGYPALLSLAYRVLGEHPASAVVLHSILGVLGAVCVHVVASASESRTTARLAGLVVALHPALLAYTPALMTEGVTSALLALPFALAVVAARRSVSRPLPLLFLSGLALGAVSLVRPQALLLTPLVVWLAFPGKATLARQAMSIALVVAGVALAIFPWTVRNERALGRPVLVSANGGWNLLIGTDPAANGTWRALEAPDECRTVWDEAAKDVCFGRAARARIAAHPLEWLALVPAKLAATFDLGGTGPSYLSRGRPDLVSHEAVLAAGGVETLIDRLFVLAALLAIVLGEGPHALPRRWIGLGASAFILLRHAWPMYVGLAVVLSLLGGRKLASRPLLAVTWGMLVSTIMTHATFFGASRYALLVMPWVAATAAAGWHARRERSVIGLEAHASS